MSTRSVVALAAAAVVAASTGLTALESVLDAPAWTPDAIEHAAIANAFCHAHGFVDPIHFNYSIDARVPVPAFALRAPLVPLLLAIPICFGATLTEASLWHALWSGVIAGGAVLVAARWMSLPAAVGAVSLITATFWWQFVAATPLTEVTAFGALLLLIATMPGVLRSPGGAIACATATVAVWLARPNLAVAAVAVVGTVLWLHGVRSVLSRPFLVYAAALAAMIGAIHVAVARSTGFAPYESGAVFGQILDVSEASRYGYVYPPRLSFMSENWDAIARIARGRLAAIWQSLFVSDVLLRLGWVAVPAIAYTLWRRDRQRPESVFCALLAINLSAVVVTNYSFFEPRYLLFPTILGALVALPLGDGAARALGERWAASGRSTWRHVPRIGLCALVAVFVIPSLPGVSAVRSLDSMGEVARRAPPDHREWCRFPGDAIVATDAPWRVHLWCGNAAVMIPHNLRDAGVLERFLAEQRVRYLLVTAPRAKAFLQRSPSLRQIPTPGGAGDPAPQPAKRPKAEPALYEVLANSAVTGWSTPGPLERIGHRREP